MNIFQLHLDDFIWRHFGECAKQGCKFCSIQQTIDITQLDDTMNGQALQKQFGGLSAKAMFKKLDWLLPARAPPTPSTSKKLIKSSRTNELVEKWKNKSLPKNPFLKKGHSEKTSHEKKNDDDENDDLFLEKPIEKKKKN